MPNIVRTRLARALRCTQSGKIQRKRTGQRRRRGSYEKGLTVYAESVHFREATGQLERIDRMCKALDIERAIFIRDALEVYLSMAETEFSEDNELPDLEPIERKPRKRKALSPD